MTLQLKKTYMATPKCLHGFRSSHWTLLLHWPLCPGERGECHFEGLFQILPCACDSAPGVYTHTEAGAQLESELVALVVLLFHPVAFLLPSRSNYCQHTVPPEQWGEARLLDGLGQISKPALQNTLDLRAILYWGFAEMRKCIFWFLRPFLRKFVTCVLPRRRHCG